MPSFNKKQRTAVEHVNGPCIVLAGPGSGKTTVITYRTKKADRGRRDKSCQYTGYYLYKSGRTGNAVKISLYYGRQISGCFWNFSCHIF